MTPESSTPADIDTSSIIDISRRSTRQSTNGRAVNVLYDSRVHPMDRVVRPARHAKIRDSRNKLPLVDSMMVPEFRQTADQFVSRKATPRASLPSATRRSKRSAAAVVHDYCTARHPQDAEIFGRRKTRSRKESRSFNDRDTAIDGINGEPEPVGNFDSDVYVPDARPPTPPAQEQWIEDDRTEAATSTSGQSIDSFCNQQIPGGDYIDPTVCFGFSGPTSPDGTTDSSATLPDDTSLDREADTLFFQPHVPTTGQVVSHPVVVHECGTETRTILT